MALITADHANKLADPVAPDDFVVALAEALAVVLCTTGPCVTLICVDSLWVALVEAGADDVLLEAVKGVDDAETPDAEAEPPDTVVYYSVSLVRTWCRRYLKEVGMG
jgi:hypothetical protein